VSVAGDVAFEAGHLPVGVACGGELFQLRGKINHGLIGGSSDTVSVGALEVDLADHDGAADEVDDQVGEESPVEVTGVEFQSGEAVPDTRLQLGGCRVAGGACGVAGDAVAWLQFVGGHYRSPNHWGLTADRAQ
jgi:hypothetical protein